MMNEPQNPSWKVVKLSDLAEVKGRIGWRGLKKSEYTKEGPILLSIGNIAETGIDFQNVDHLTWERYYESPEIAIAPQDILMGKDGTLGKVAFVESIPYETTISSTLAKIRVKSKLVIPRFLYFFFKSALFQTQVVESKTGSTVPHFVQKNIKSAQIPLPSMSTQKRIVQILDKGVTLKRKREQANLMGGKILQAVFLQMFGDPTNNPKNWDLKTLPEFVAKDKYAIKRGPFGGSLKKEIFKKEGYLVYEQYHAINDDFSMARYFVDEEKFKEMEKFRVVAGDLIISCSGVTLGRIAEIPENARQGIINQALLKISLDKSKMNNSYFIFLFRQENVQTKIFNLSHGSGQPNFPSISEIKSVEFMTPPIRLQEEFASIVKKAGHLKEKQKNSSEEIEKLFNSLMYKAFKAELLSKPQPEKQGPAKEQPSLTDFMNKKVEELHE